MSLVRLNTRSLPDDAVTGAKIENNPTIAGALSANGGAVFNENSADVDFRVEGNNDTHALFVQAGSDHVGINNTSPNSQLGGADNLVVGNTGVATSGMTFVGSGGSGSQGLIHFSDSNSGNARYDGFIGYEHTDRFMKFGTAQAERLRIDSNGHVTMPQQSAFMATSSSQSNLATSNTLAFGNEVFDQNADYNNSNYIFTAPVTGRYQLNATIRTDNLDTAANYIRIFLKTSNRNYEAIYDLGGLSGDPSYWTFTLTALADMDANDNAFLEWSQSGGASQSGIGNVESSYSGYLVA